MHMNITYKYVNTCFLALKKNKMMWFAGKWMEVELIMLDEIAKHESTVSRVFSPMQNLGLKRSERRGETIWKEEGGQLGVKREKESSRADAILSQYIMYMYESATVKPIIFLLLIYTD